MNGLPSLAVLAQLPDAGQLFARPTAHPLAAQQERFDRFVHVYNQERPHQGLDMKYPAELYVTSSRPYRGLSDLEYPFHDHTITVTNCGRICLGKRKINLSTVFAGQNVGIKEVSDKVWLVDRKSVV